MTDPAEPPNFHSPANIFLQKEVYRLGSQPGLRSLPPSPERDFITLTWGPVIYRTTYAPESQRLILLYLRGLNETIRKSLPRVLEGSSEQLARLEQCYSSKVFTSQETLHGVDEGFVRDAFHDWKVALSVPAIELPVRLRVCMLIDDAVLAAMTGIVDEAAREVEDADISRCPIKVVEENFPDVNHPESVSAADDEPYSGSTTVVLGALVEMYDGLRQGKLLADYHKQGRISTPSSSLLSFILSPQPYQCIIGTVPLDGFLNELAALQMDAFVSRKRPRLGLSPPSAPSAPPAPASTSDEEPTEVKLALLLSVFPNVTQEALLNTLVLCGGSVEGASSILSTPQQQQQQQQQRETASTESRAITTTPKKRATPSGIQTSLLPHITPSPKPSTNLPIPKNPQQQQPLTRKGRTLHLYTSQDIAHHTPCTIIHNFLPTHTATALLQELLSKSHHFSRHKFQLFERTVQSPHSASVYVSTPEEYRQQTSEYTYGGTYRSNVRQITPHMRDVSGKVKDAVNEEIRRRIRDVYPRGEKLRYQSPRTWRPNAAFVNCYDGPAESVGFHSDELTYLGPRAVIGSLSLGVEREFRVRRVVADDDDGDDGDDGNDTAAQKQKQNERADAQGQISIHLPHNSLLVMHAEMQEEWKHAITPAQTVNPHPVSGNRRINITYRWYRDSLHPRYTPKCRCGTHAILRCAQRKRETRGRYMWMCYAGYAPGGKGCSFFQWAEFDDDGEPLWANKPTEEQAPTLTNFVASQLSDDKG